MLVRWNSYYYVSLILTFSRDSVTHVIKVRLASFCTECSVAWPCLVSSAGAWLPTCPFPCLFGLWSCHLPYNTFWASLRPHLPSAWHHWVLPSSCHLFIWGAAVPFSSRFGNRLQQTSDRLFSHCQLQIWYWIPLGNFLQDDSKYCTGRRWRCGWKRQI